MKTISRKRLADVMKFLRPDDRDKIIVSIMLNAMDEVLIDMWGHLGDMGMSKNEFLRLKSKAKARL